MSDVSLPQTMIFGHLWQSVAVAAVLAGVLILGKRYAWIDALRPQRRGLRGRAGAAAGGVHPRRDDRGEPAEAAQRAGRAWRASRPRRSWLLSRPKRRPRLPTRWFILRFYEGATSVLPISTIV